jgi:hypothetical protein
MGLPTKFRWDRGVWAPVGDGVFKRSLLAAKADEIYSIIDKTIQVLNSRSAQADHSVTHFSSHALADSVCSTNRPS